MERAPSLHLIRPWLNIVRQLGFKELKVGFFRHPLHPSLYAVTEVPEYFGAQDMALEVPTDMENLQQLPETFLSKVIHKAQILISKLDSRVTSLFHGNLKPNIGGFHNFFDDMEWNRRWKRYV